MLPLTVSSTNSFQECIYFDVSIGNKTWRITFWQMWKRVWMNPLMVMFFSNHCHWRLKCYIKQMVNHWRKSNWFSYFSFWTISNNCHQNCHYQIINAKINLREYYQPPYERTIFLYSQANVDHIQQAINLFDWENDFLIVMLMPKCSFFPTLS